MTTTTTSTATTKGLSEYSEAVQHDVAKTREIVDELHAELPRWGLVVWTAGNVSQRVVVDPESGPGPDDLFVIKPSGVSYDDLTPEAMVVCNTEGELIEGTKLPSSDTDRKSTRLNSSHVAISYAVFCLKKKTADWEAREPA